jgi:hypothetical protein
LEERLKRAFERMKRDGVGLGDDQTEGETHAEDEEDSTGKHAQETTVQSAEQTREFEHAAPSATGPHDPVQQVEEEDAEEAQEFGQHKEQQHVTLASEPEADTYVEPEPVSRFSREEKGKGKAVEDRRDALLFGPPAEDLSLAPVVTLAQEIPVAETAAREVTTEKGERPSRSYLASPRIRSGGVENEEVSAVETTCELC